MKKWDVEIRGLDDDEIIETYVVTGKDEGQAGRVAFRLFEDQFPHEGAMIESVLEVEDDG